MTYPYRNIRRVIFYSLCKLQLNADLEKEIKLISVSSALQIAGKYYQNKTHLRSVISFKSLNNFEHSLFTFKTGRAGRFGSQWENGFVTTFKPIDLPTLKFLLGEKPEPIEQAGLHPTADQIAMYSYHLPNSSISNLVVCFRKMLNSINCNVL